MTDVIGDIQFFPRRDTHADLASQTPSQYEVGLVKDRNEIVIGDGSTPGGGARLPPISTIQKGTFQYKLAGGTATALTIDFGDGYRPAAYVAGMSIRVLTASASTGAAAVNVTGAAGTGLGAKTIKKWSNGALADIAAGDWASGQMITLDYDGTYFQISGGIGGGGWTKLAAATASGSGAITLTGMSTAFDEYIAVFTGVRPATDNTPFLARLGAGSVDSTNKYWHAQYRASTSGASGVNTPGTFDSKFDISGQLGFSNATAAVTGGQVHIHRPADSAVYTAVDWSLGGWVSTIDGLWVAGGGGYLVTSAVDRISFLMVSGNIAAGEFALYGVNK